MREDDALRRAVCFFVLIYGDKSRNCLSEGQSIRVKDERWKLQVEECYNKIRLKE